MKNLLLLALALVIVVTVVNGRRGGAGGGGTFCEDGAEVDDVCTKDKGPVSVCKDEENSNEKLSCVPDKTVCAAKAEGDACPDDDSSRKCLKSPSCEENCILLCVPEGKGSGKGVGKVKGAGKGKGKGKGKGATKKK